ncbi:unnamed protein product [Trichobilharzia regenti]|nr:unnamed protein product [Trichobilharzia regenti]
MIIERADPVHLATIEEEYANIRSTTYGNTLYANNTPGGDVSHNAWNSDLDKSDVSL